MNKLDSLISLIKRYDMTGEPDLEEKISKLKYEISEDTKKAIKYDEYHYDPKSTEGVFNYEYVRKLQNQSDELLKKSKEFQSALKLQELVKERMRNCDWGDNENWNFHLNELQSLVDESQTTLKEE